MKKYDVVIIGGGTAGCAAAYMAGILGLKVLLLEKNIHLGGAITSGLVVPAMKCGDSQINTEFFEALVSELKSMGGQVTYDGNSGWFNPELTKIALDNLMRKAAVEVRFCSNITNVVIENNTVTGIEFPLSTLSAYNLSIQNNKEILSEYIDAKYFVDATGNCDFGKFCNCEFLQEKNETQPTSLRFIMGGVDIEKFADWLEEFDSDRNVTTVERIGKEVHLSTAYTWDKNKTWALAPLFEEAVAKGVLQDTDRNYFQVFTIPGMPSAIAFNCPRILEDLDDFNSKNVSNVLMKARNSIYRLSEFCKKYLTGFENAYISNIADELGIRVSRRIKGKYIYTIDDLKSGKKFENPVLISNYPVDVHSKEKNQSTLQVVADYQLPVESLMSADFENLFVVGRCISSDFMSQGALRVQASCFAMGVGLAKYLANLEIGTEA